ncbi:GDP-mannose 4,6-dehydratase [soil metagenome]
MKFLVTGGAGFVGSHLCRRLVSDGHEVTCVDNLITGQRGNITDLLDQPAFRFVEADVTQTPTLNVDVIMHLASPASPVDYDRYPLETMTANSQGTWRLLDIARETGARVVFVSTSEAYGDPLVHPQPETYWGNVDPIGPRACYDESKRFGEALLMTYRRVHGVSAAIVRVFNTYGPAMRLDDGRVMPEFFGAAFAGEPLRVHGDGSQTRSFMYVDDLVEGLLHVALDKQADGQVLNIGNPEEITIGELAETIVRRFAPQAKVKSVPARDGDPKQRCPDIGRMIARYGWRPTVPLEDGLRATADWYRGEVQARAVSSGEGQHGGIGLAVG